MLSLARTFKMSKILIIEDDLALVEAVRDWLKADKYAVDAVHDGVSGWQMLKSFTYEAIILDWELPGKSGMDILHSYRKAGGTTPVLMLTGKNSIDEKEAGLYGGADDYLTKPFHPRELLARLRTIMRRPAQMRSDLLSSGSVSLDVTNHQAFKDGVEILLAPLEFRLLALFMNYPREVFSIEAIIDRVWESEEPPSFDSIYSCIRRVRSKFDRKGRPSIIRTVHGVGYGLGKDECSV